MLIQLDGEEVTVPAAAEDKTWRSPETKLTIQWLPETNNKVKVKVEGLSEITARVVPITPEESRVHG